jgi:hypothetical protein
LAEIAAYFLRGKVDDVRLRAAMGGLPRGNHASLDLTRSLQRDGGADFKAQRKIRPPGEAVRERHYRKLKDAHQHVAGEPR